jgi:hypothetical protein
VHARGVHQPPYPRHQLVTPPLSALGAERPFYVHFGDKNLQHLFISADDISEWSGHRPGCPRCALRAARPGLLLLAVRGTTRQEFVAEAGASRTSVGSWELVVGT